MKTLEAYLRDCLSKGIIDHSIRAQECNGKVTFYIHPDSRSGDTIDFAVTGNELTLGGWSQTGNA